MRWALPSDGAEPVRWVPSVVLFNDLTEADDDGRFVLAAGAVDGVQGLPSTSAVNCWSTERDGSV